jgi:hypothetical protein
VVTLHIQRVNIAYFLHFAIPLADFFAVSPCKNVLILYFQENNDKKTDIVLKKQHSCAMFPIGKKCLQT